MSGEKSTHVSDAKKEIVKNLLGLIESKKTILLASIKNLPASQFQEIGKKLRGKAIVKVPKKNLIFRAIDSSKKEEIKQLKEHIKNSTAILFSDLDTYELAGELLVNKSPAKAKPGQEAPSDIEIQSGPTDLPPGPAISELGAVGLQVQIQDGKIHIKDSKVIVKEGEKISPAAADIMAKLDIKPFSIGFIPVSSFDTQEGKLYLNIKIDKEETLSELKTEFAKALGFAVGVCYICQDTIKVLITKAGSHKKALEKFSEARVSEDKNDVSNKRDEDNKEPQETNKPASEDNNSKNSEPQSEANTQSDKSGGEDK